MQLVGFVSTDHIVEAFRRDSEVMRISMQWPDTPFMRLILLRIAQRPVDNILRCAWKQWLLNQNELLARVFAVWHPPGFANYSWSLGEMIAAIEAETFTPPPEKWNAVQRLEAEMRTEPPSCIGPLIGYQYPGRIHLEDGHTRVAAASLAKALPPTITMYIGELPDRLPIML
jgi:hypothetical protein